MTNLIAAVTLSLLVTNTEIKYPMHVVPGPWPPNQGSTVPAVFYSHMEPDANPTTRDVVETVTRIEITRLDGLGVTLTNKVEKVREMITPQRAVTTWESLAPVVRTNFDAGWLPNGMSISNVAVFFYGSDSNFYIHTNRP